MSFRSRRHLENQVADALEAAEKAERARQEAAQRAARVDDIRGGLLALHQPHAQLPQDSCEPELYCTSCANEWPCETVQFVFRFGKFAPSTEIEPTN